MESTFARGSSAPSKKIIALGIFVVSIVAVVVIFKADAKDSTHSALVSSEERSVITETDRDNDGLKDWQESLYNTNPEIADTDGDGIRDKEDVEREQEEKEREEQELLAQNVSVVMEDPETWDSLSYSQATSRLLLAQYLSHKDPGVPLEDEEISSIVSGLPQYEAPSRTYVPFTDADIVVTDDNTANSLREYGNALALILREPQDGSPVPNELLVLQSFAQKEDGDTFIEQLGDVVAQYTYVLESMGVLPVPEELADVHLLIMNRMGVVRNDFETMQSLQDNPYVAVSAISAYGRDSSAVAEAFDRLHTAFQDNGIVFTDTEPGSIFNE